MSRQEAQARKSLLVVPFSFPRREFAEEYHVETADKGTDDINQKTFINGGFFIATDLASAEQEACNLTRQMFLIPMALWSKA